MQAKGFVVVLLLVAVALAGCSDGGKGGDGTGSKIDVRTGATIGGPGGALAGTVIDDISLPVGGAIVTVDETFHSVQTAANGTFRMDNITAGTYVVRIAHPEYFAAKQDIVIVAGVVTELTAILVLKSAASGDMRAHVHDVWGTRTTLPLIEGTDFDWHDPYDDTGPYAESFGRYYDTATHATIHPCVWTDSQDEVYFNQRLIWFDDPAALVYAGTKSIEVTLNWDANDYPDNQLMLAWRSANSTTFTQGSVFDKGTTYSIPVQHGDWDSSHQSFSLWDIYLCTPDDSGPGGQTGNVHAVQGSITVDLVLTRIEGVIPPERAHPVFWPEDGRVEVIKLNDTKVIGGAYSLSRSTFNSAFVVRPDAKALVPPRTKELQVHLEWSYDSPLPVTDPWSLTYRPANLRFWDMKDPGEMMKVDPSGESASSRDYVIPVSSAESDQFYQSRSNWYFFLNLEGKEADWNYVSPCDCDVHFTISVTAIKADDA